jgi:hypothetical protein
MRHAGGGRFKLMLVAMVIYLGWRTFQGVTWVIHHV